MKWVNGVAEVKNISIAGMRMSVSVSVLKE